MAVMRGSWGLVLAAALLLGRLPSLEAIQNSRMIRRQCRGLDVCNKDLVFTHLPYNFGFTIGGVARFGCGMCLPSLTYLASHGILGDKSTRIPGVVPSIDNPEQPAMQENGALWGHFVPVLERISDVTGCPLYNTPPKHWPEDIREKYYVDGQSVFGVLRDPYDRLVAIFRGENTVNTGDYAAEFATCNVNGAVKKMMKSYLEGGKNIYAGGCHFLPQAEWFDDVLHPVTIPIDNRRFPTSMNEVFAKHGYSNMIIEADDVVHVAGCNNVWSADLDTETRDLVKKVYWRDFELLCKHFNYCDTKEDTCLPLIDQMCPEKAFHWNSSLVPPQYVPNVDQ